MAKFTHKLIICSLLLGCLAGSALAQSDNPYVIKVRNSGHYLAHIYNNGVYSLGDLTEFTPECIWYSGVEHNITGTNHNYYFYDTVTDNYRFLTAPMTTNGTLGLSDNLPPTYLLSNTDTIYYFYNWDPEDKPNSDGGGVARGHQYYGLTEQQCTHSWGDGECWDVYWVVYNNGWKTSAASYYDIDDIPSSTSGVGGRFHKVTVEEHPAVTTVSSGSLANLSDWTPTTVPTSSSTPSQNFSLSVSNGSFNITPAYTTYSFRERHMPDSTAWDTITSHFSGSTQVTPPLTPVPDPNKTPVSYEWTLTGQAAQFLSFNSSGTPVHSINGSVSGTSLSTTVYYLNENTSGQKTATLKLVVTYEGGYTQECTATITLGTLCQNPPEAASPVVSYNDVTVSWYDIADGYKLKWKKTDSSSWNDSVVVNHGTDSIVSHTITNLEYGASYQYRVFAFCTDHYLTFASNEYTGTFAVPNNQHKLLVYGSIFGGGRMADVKGRTEVVVINCDSIGAVFGGNDIAGAVRDSSIVVIGVNNGGAYSSYGTTDSCLRITDVYGGGNGYYAYNNNTFSPVAPNAPTVNIESGNGVYALSPSNGWNTQVWVNSGSTDTTLSIPSISKTSITVASDYVKIDSLFGGAKNAFLTYNNANHNADSIVIDGGTILAVFGGNNVGGSQGAGKHLVKVNHTTTYLHDSIVNTATTGYGRDFGIRYLYGGGNKVAASTTDVIITGGQLDTIFAGGNSADVTGANITVNCSFGTRDGNYTFGNVYSNAINTSAYPAVYSGSFSGDYIKNDYSWNGLGGIYNVRTLFGGNNQANMNVVPTVTLTSGSVGTVYGGGNAGDMVFSDDTHNTEIANDFGAIIIDYQNNTTSPINISTHVVLSSANMLIDYLYGGCQMSNVYRSAWVEMQNGHVGTVYGGCNISGDVGSHYLFDDGYTFGPRHEKYQAVQGATYVKVSGGVIYKNLFAGSNGRYHCNNGVYYIDGIDYADPEHYYINTPTKVPTHNETHVFVSGTAEVKGSVYAGGNLACVGFNDATVPAGVYYPKFVGMATVRMNGGTVRGNVFGGGNMASIWGSNSVSVEGGVIGGALYGGNDRIGLVAQITNRVLPPTYGKASDNYTSLADVRTYVSVTGRPDVNTVYGGGNGDYDYNTGEYCDPNDQPVQSNTFVDINIDGYALDDTHPGGHIGTVYGGGNGVTVTGTTTVFLNVVGQNGGEPTAYDHVGTIFGGNNKGPLAIVPEIILLKGQVNTVYGGCNQGAMLSGKSFSFGGTVYNNIGSMVHLLNEYPGANNTTVVPTAKVSNAVYGGCRMNGVTNNSLVLVEGGTFGDTVNFFGGSDISGIIGGTSRVVVKAGTHNNGSAIGNAFGGGNGNYIYNGNKVYTLNNVLIDTIASGAITRPSCEYTQVDMISGTAANLYGGGNAAGVMNTSTVNMNGGQVTAGLYGGCCSMDTIHGDVTVNVLGGTVGTDATHRADIFGGGYGQLTRTDGNVEVNITRATGTNPPEAPTIYGDIYGGSALGHVNDTMNSSGISAHTTTVNILDGSITGDVYGGGLGEYTDNQHDSIAAIVNGKVYVNIGAKNGNTYSGNITFNTYGTDGNQGGNVFGGNNVYGTPLDSVFVNIYQTGHTGDPDAVAPYSALGNYYPATVPSNPTADWLDALPEARGNFAIQSVYGGGNKASYTPPLAAGQPRAARVHVYQCNNTINDVYGGGNAANVGTTGTDAVATNTFVIVDGGRINRVFGGGNGEVTPANIYGTSSNTVNGGLINQVFGCGNMQGSITNTNLNLSNTGDCTVEVFGEVFGGANQAAFNGNLTTTIACGVGTIGSIYGGSNLADITGDVTLTIQGGDFKEVYGGSKGAAQAADIDGTVTLNLQGGTIIQAFGGSNVNGNITGLITVNVDTIAGACPLVLDTLFGSGNLTAYTPTQVNGNLITSPIVNLKNGTVRQAVFGSGKGSTAVVTANPQVNIGDSDNNVNRIAQVGYLVGTTIHGGDVYGGGFQGAVNGGPVVNIQKANTLVYHQVFGGGDMADVDSTVVNIHNGMVKTGIYGGCKVQGNVGGDIEVNVFDGVLGAVGTPMGEGIFGGGLGEPTTTSGNVTVNIGDASHAPTLYADVYGGSALGKVHTQTNNATEFDTTYVNFAKGTLHGNLYGGGLGDSSTPAEVYGSVEVNIGKDKDGTTVNGGTIYGSVFGANNIKGSPKGSVTVNMYSATIDSIFGGGNHAAYVPAVTDTDYPEINISNGQVNCKVVGGGNAAGIGDATASISANPQVNISGGTICTTTTNSGVYGGCNESGTVTGDITVNITGQATIGSETLSLTEEAPVNVHGGGYGKQTQTTGDVTVNFGTLAYDNSVPPVEIHQDYPKLFGDLYGGSAFGDVNDGASDKTTVNILNGTVTCVSRTVSTGLHDTTYYYSGRIYGGGLGRKADNENGITAIAAKVNGVVHVNVGSSETVQNSQGHDSTVYHGKASLVDCEVYGCNNANGSPQQNVYVDVYQTTHVVKDSVNYLGDDATYAIKHVFGGGNEANFAPDENSGYTKKTHSTVHKCDNTIDYVYGGGNAADSDGTEVNVDGGRFNFIFGGGNGQISPANILNGGVDITISSGYVGWYFNGCNMQGTVPEGHVVEHYGCTTDCPCDDTLNVLNYYFGANQATIYEGLDHTIACGDKMSFRNVYAGSRLAVVYGDIKLTVQGGIIGNLYGGNEGSQWISADVRKYPTDSTTVTDPKLKAYLGSHPEKLGQGGNIYLTLQGGKLGNVYGGNNYHGNVEGNIYIEVDSLPGLDEQCRLDIDYIYGGSNLAGYYPFKADTLSPVVYLKRGHVNYDVFGGSKGGATSHNFGNGKVITNPKVIIGDENGAFITRVGRDVFGGGSAGDVQGNTKVILQGKTTVGGDVFGGSKRSNVSGSTEVILAPTNSKSDQDK